MWENFKAGFSSKDAQKVMDEANAPLENPTPVVQTPQTQQPVAPEVQQPQVQQPVETQQPIPPQEQQPAAPQVQPWDVQQPTNNV